LKSDVYGKKKAIFFTNIYVSQNETPDSTSTPVTTEEGNVRRVSTYACVFMRHRSQVIIFHATKIAESSFAFFFSFCRNKSRANNEAILVLMCGDTLFPRLPPQSMARINLIDGRPIFLSVHRAALVVFLRCPIELSRGGREIVTLLHQRV